MNSQSITIKFLGVPEVGRGVQQIDLQFENPVPIRQVFSLASHTLGDNVLPENIEKNNLIIAAGRHIAHLQQWDTIVQPGDLISVVPLVGGG